jgi:hypothetical protein
MTTTTTTELWVSNAGHVNCREHGGGYFEAHLRANPNARRFTTPLNAWERVSDADRAEWLAEMGEPITCEGCES